MTSDVKKLAALSSKPLNNRTPIIKYEEGEKILCYHGALIYEAKCLKVQAGTRAKEALYLVHYNGWNKNWDEWVNTSRILKLNEENLKKQQDLIIATRLKDKKAAQQLLLANEGSGPVGVKSESGESEGEQLVEGNKLRSSKRGNQSNEILSSDLETDLLNETSTSPKIVSLKLKKNICPKKRICIININSRSNRYLTNQNLKIQLPENLKEWLVDDYDAVNQQNKLIRIPCDRTFSNILDDFISFKMANEPEEEHACLEKRLNETKLGLITYFNTMLGSQLLYKFERIQYTQVLKMNKPMCDLYGAIHMLRLFQRLEQMLCMVPLEESPLEVLIANINEIISFLDDKHETFFSLNDYILVPPEYIRLSF